MLSCEVSARAASPGYRHVYGEASEPSLAEATRLSPRQPNVGKEDWFRNQTSHLRQQGRRVRRLAQRTGIQEELGRHKLQEG